MPTFKQNKTSAIERIDSTNPIDAARSDVDTAKALFDFWNRPALIQANNFKYKSLSSWAFNIAVGCSHACRFCYVPDASTKKQVVKLREYGVTDPDAQWGAYSLLRPFDEKAFRESLRRAQATPEADLNLDGNRAVIYSSTTDPYQAFHGRNAAKLNRVRDELVRRSLELILEESTLNVRILTRSPLAEKDFDLYKRFGNRLAFGMSIPTLDDSLARIYEPSAPGVAKRLKTLKSAKREGLHVFVAMAPTYPECDEVNLRATLEQIAELDPITVFHEPINIRAENVERIRAHAESIGRSVNTHVYQTRESWRHYAIGQLALVEKLSEEVGLRERLHLWPDKSLRSEVNFLRMRDEIFFQSNPNRRLTTFETEQFAKENREAYKEFVQWIDAWHNRISEWPGKEQVS